jgi:hypothetical protein
MQQLFLLLTCLSCLAASAQVEKGKSIEGTLLGRYDKHADYTSRFGDRSYTNHTQLAGISYGLSLAYSYPLNQRFRAKGSLGYYQLRIDQVRQSTPFGTATARNFEDLSDSTKMLHSTSKYHYNTLPLSAGIQMDFPLKRNISFTAGADFLYYFTYNQRYQRNYSKAYNTSNSRLLGWGVNVATGWRKEYRSFYINPQLLIPMYQRLKSDPVFREAANLRIPKWFNGGGLSVSIGKYL